MTKDTCGTTEASSMRQGLYAPWTAGPSTPQVDVHLWREDDARELVDHLASYLATPVKARS
jgi:hypothetical protein